MSPLAARASLNDPDVVVGILVLDETFAFRLASGGGVAFRLGRALPPSSLLAAPVLAASMRRAAKRTAGKVATATSSVHGAVDGIDSAPCASAVVAHVATVARQSAS